MVTRASIDLLSDFWSDSGWDRDPTGQEETSAVTSAERPLSEELGTESIDGSEDEGWDPPEDDPINSRRYYANSVGMRLWEKI